MAFSIMNIAPDRCICKPHVAEAEWIFRVTILGYLHVSILEDNCRACATRT